LTALDPSGNLLPEPPRCRLIRTEPVRRNPCVAGAVQRAGSPAATPVRAADALPAGEAEGARATGAGTV